MIKIIRSAVIFVAALCAATTSQAALQSLNAPILFPGQSTNSGSGVASIATMNALSASGNHTGFIFQAITAQTISQIEVNVAALTTNPSTVTVTLETINGSGKCSGTNYGTSSAGTSASITTTGWISVTLGASATTSIGDYICANVTFASGNLNLGRVTNSIPYSNNLPYIDESGSLVQFSGARETIALSDGSGNYMPIPGDVVPVSITSNTYNNTGTPSRALRFQVPFKTKLAGAVFTTNGSSGNFNAILTNSSGTTIASQAVVGINQNLQNGTITVLFSSPVAISPGTTYYLTQEATSATNTQNQTFNLNAAGLRAAMPGGLQVYYATRTTSGTGAFTDDTTRVPLIDLLFDQLDDGAGGAGGGGGIIGG